MSPRGRTDRRAGLPTIGPNPGEPGRSPPRGGLPKPRRTRCRGGLPAVGRQRPRGEVSHHRRPSTRGGRRRGGGEVSPRRGEPYVGEQACRQGGGQAARPPIRQAARRRRHRHHPRGEVSPSRRPSTRGAGGQAGGEVSPIGRAGSPPRHATPPGDAAGSPTTPNAISAAPTPRQAMPPADAQGLPKPRRTRRRATRRQGSKAGSTPHHDAQKTSPLAPNIQARQAGKPTPIKGVRTSRLVVIPLRDNPFQGKKDSHERPSRRPYLHPPSICYGRGKIPRAEAGGGGRGQMFSTPLPAEATCRDSPTRRRDSQARRTVCRQANKTRTRCRHDANKAKPRGGSRNQGSKPRSRRPLPSPTKHVDKQQARQAAHLAARQQGKGNMSTGSTPRTPPDAQPRARRTVCRHARRTVCRQRRRHRHRPRGEVSPPPTPINAGEVSPIATRGQPAKRTAPPPSIRPTAAGQCMPPRGGSHKRRRQPMPERPPPHQTACRAPTDPTKSRPRTPRRRA